MIYEIPEEPDSGVVWGWDGQEWVRNDEGAWQRPGGSGLSMYWTRLLQSFGPLTDVRPVQVGG